MDRKRLLLALVLSIAILMGYSLVMNRFFPPSPPVIEEPPPTPSQPAPSNPKPQAPATSPATSPAKATATATPGTPAPVAQVPPRDIVIDTPYWEVTLTNRGAVATAWLLNG